MKILSNVTMAGNVSMASNAKDSFTIGSELERDNPSADELIVWANANFYNDVLLGSSSVDIVNVKGQLTSSQGLSTSGSLYFTGQNSTIYLGPNDWIDYVQTALNPLKPTESTGSGVSLIYDDDPSKTYLRSLRSDQDRINITTYNNNTEILVELAPQRYDYSVLTSATGTIGTNNTENSEVNYINNLGNNGLSWTLPSAQSYITRVITIKNISSQYDITLNASGSETIDSAASLTMAVSSSYTLQAVDNNGYKWYIIGKYS